MRGESWIREDGRRRGGRILVGMRAVGDRWRRHELREMRCNVRRHDGAESVRKNISDVSLGSVTMMIFTPLQPRGCSLILPTNT